jgi:hypothetical protein
MLCENPTLQNSLASADKLKVLRVLRLPEETAYLVVERKRRFRGQLPLTQLERGAVLLNNITIAPNGCWLWSNIKPGTYAMFRENGRYVRLARFIWELVHGPVPDGIEVCHDCPNGQDDTRCINPAHLWLGTHQENMDDREAKGRGHQAKGEKCWASKLTACIVLEIRRQYKFGLSGVLAKKYGVSRNAILKIVQRRSWKSI